MTNGTTFYYYLHGVSEAGYLSAPSHIFSGIPKADPFPPIGSVIIGRNVRFVSSTSVVLHLEVEDVVPSQHRTNAAVPIMRISNSRNFLRSAWQTFQPQVSWTLSPNAGGDCWVFAQFRDAEMNYSEVYPAHAHYRPLSSLGRILLHVSLRDFPSLLSPLVVSGLSSSAGPGIPVYITNDPSLPPFYTDEQGNVVLDNLPPGTYNLLIQAPGYIPGEVNGVGVGTGQTVTVGDRTLYPWTINLPLVRR